jgi:hypothetical protein
MSLSTLLAVGIGAWGLSAYAGSESLSGLIYGVLSLLAVPLLLVYGVKVRRKLKALGAFSS